METIIIKDNLDKIIVNIKNDSFDGYRFLNDGSVEKIDNRIYDIFSMFILSNNYRVLPKENDYDVVLDNETNFKHYFKDGLEDYKMFYLNNGRVATVYKKDKDDKVINDETPREFESKKGSVTLELISLIFVMCATLAFGSYYENTLKPSMIKTPAAVYQKAKDEYVMHEYTLDEVKNRIYSSNELTDDDKAFLYNEDFFRDILPYVNSNSYANYLFDQKYNNITIKRFEHDKYACNGFYSPAYLNEINISNNDDHINYYDVLSHEFVHLNQADYEYDILVEAGAELVSSEYFAMSPAFSYSEETIILRNLMEVIGAEPIREYLFAGNDDLLKEKINEYLDPSESELFFSSLVVSQNPDLSYIEEELDNNIDNLNNLIGLIYTRKFGGNIKDDVALRSINLGITERYYFNKKLINTTESIVSYNDYVTYDIMTALDKGVLEDVLCYNDETGNYDFLDIDTIKERNGTFTDDDMFFGFVTYSTNSVIVSANENGELVATCKKEMSYPIPNIDEKFASEKVKSK